MLIQIRDLSPGSTKSRTTPHTRFFPLWESKWRKSVAAMENFNPWVHPGTPRSVTRFLSGCHNRHWQSWIPFGSQVPSLLWDAKYVYLEVAVMMYLTGMCSSSALASHSSQSPRLGLCVAQKSLRCAMESIGGGLSKPDIQGRLQFPGAKVFACHLPDNTPNSSACPAGGE